jgi:hypothetical protein
VGLLCADGIPRYMEAGAVPAVHALVVGEYAGHIEHLEMVHGGLALQVVRS